MKLENRALKIRGQAVDKVHLRFLVLSYFV